MWTKVVAVAAGLAFAVVLGSGAMAAEEPKSETLKGTLSVTKSEDGKKDVIALKVGDVVYKVGGKKAKELAALDKKEVEITGMIKEKDGKKSIVMESFKEVPAAAAPKGDAPKVEAPKVEATK